ncbi:thymidine kinase [Clostridiaceae bacterium OttesenSCG-928-D20]|nr:thymidine kinase [Clostridiaceae bacterium OttesenSCG-928-D20]
MGSSKSAQALITKFNYEELGMRVWLIKPSVDDRFGADLVKSRIGLSAKAQNIYQDSNIINEFQRLRDIDVIIADESQFFMEWHIDQLRELVDSVNIPVICFGLRVDFRTKLFPGSKRLFELADSISEIKTVCKCGSKATVNARFDEKGRVLSEGEQVVLGGNDRYIAMCHKCWKKALKEQNYRT